MSKARFDASESWSSNVSHALQLLNEALAIVDKIDRPDIGARLQDVIEALREATPA